MTKHYTYAAKQDGDTLSAQEWNNLAQDVDEAVTAINSGSTQGTSTDTGNVTIGGTDNNSHMYLNNKGNLCIETTAENVPSGKKGKINIESKDDILLKPGDDIIFYSNHRAEGKQDEVALKVTDGDDIPVKLLMNAASVVLTTKDKTGDDANVMDVTINSAANTRGYLKVRAQAIDLRSESHGGIALQPKGYDGDGNMNKIKFEHGGGDGLEFGTFNAEKTSIFTDEYRFNRDGIVYGVTRLKEVSDKYDESDETTHYKYHKYSDDFYDKTTRAPRTSVENIINAGIFLENVSRYGVLSVEGQSFTSSSLNKHFNINVGLSGYYYELTYTSTISNPADISMHGLAQEDIDSIQDLHYVVCEENNLSSIGLTLTIINYITNANLGTNDPNLTGNLYERYFYVYNPSETLIGMLKVTRLAPQTMIKSNTSGTLTVNGTSCSLGDIVTLVNYFKTGAGLANGPWALNT